MNIMQFDIHKTSAVYGIVLLVVLSVAYSVSNIQATGYAAFKSTDLETKIISISPSKPQLSDKRISVTFSVNGAETTSSKSIFMKFNLQYPSGKNISYTAFIPTTTLQRGSITKIFLWNIDKRGTYKLTVIADPSNTIKESNEKNNFDSLIFKV